MKISVRVRDIEWTPELRKNVERSIEFAIDRYRLQVNEVSVYLADLNDAKAVSTNYARLPPIFADGATLY